MLGKWFLFALVAFFGTAVAQYGFLEEFNNEFASYSNSTREETQRLRQFNSALIREFNRELLLQFGRMVPTTRANDAAFLEVISSTLDISDECMDEVMVLFRFYQNYHSNVIRNCAFYAWNGLHTDATHRFWPYHNPFIRENNRAIYQTVQTLGRHDPFDIPGLRNEMQQQLDYYHNLRVGQLEVLEEEIVAHANAADITYRALDDCRRFIEILQYLDHEYISGYLASNCGEREVTTTQIPDHTPLLDHIGF